MTFDLPMVSQSHKLGHHYFYHISSELKIVLINPVFSSWVSCIKLSIVICPFYFFEARDK